MNAPQVFLCHAHEDKSAVLSVYDRLKNEGFRPWLDKEDLLPGQIWAEEIPRTIRASDFVLVFLSNTSVNKRGYVQKEFKIALDVLSEIPEGRLFVIPVRLDECEIPDKFKHLHWSNLYEAGSLDKIISSIRRYALQIETGRSSLDAAREPIDLALRRTRESVDSLKGRLLEVPNDLRERYESSLSGLRSGVIRLLPEGKYDGLVGIQNSGSWYSFSLATHNAHNEADIALTRKWARGPDFEITAKFKGLDYGFWLPLPGMTIDDVGKSPLPPTCLLPGHHAAWSYMWSYKPPPEIKRVRLEGYKFGHLGGVVVGSNCLQTSVPSEADKTYLLRSVNHRTSDLLVALQVARRLPDDSLVIAWKTLAEYPIPEASGPEPFGYDAADILAMDRGVVPDNYWTFESVSRRVDAKIITFLTELAKDSARTHFGPSRYLDDVASYAEDLLFLQSIGWISTWPRVDGAVDLTGRTTCFLTSLGGKAIR